MANDCPAHRLPVNGCMSCSNSSCNVVNGNQSIVGNANTISGNINITLPEKGYQRIIIRNDGNETTIEVMSPSKSNKTLSDLIAKLDRLQNLYETFLQLNLDR